MPNRRWTSGAAALSAAAVGLAGAGVAAAQPPAGAGTAGHGLAWTTGWAAAMQRPSAGFEPNWSEQGFSGQTVRQVVRVTAAGSSVRIRLSNQYGASPLKVAAATIALPGEKAAVRAGTVRRVGFGNGRSVVIPAGGQVTSDAVALPVGDRESLTVTLYLPETTGPATAHLQGYATSYRATGDHSGDASGSAFPADGKRVTHSWYYLAGVEVAGSAARRSTVVALGDSITDGFGAGNDTDERYPDQLADRLAAAGRPRPVLNAGIGGGMLLSDSAWFGERFSTRFARDVLADPRVGTLILFGGLNDIGFSEVDLPTYKPNPDRSAAQIVTGYRELIRRAHTRGIKVIGGTLLPMKGAEYYNATSAAKIRQVNRWIRTSGAYDGVVDFNRAVADPADPEKLRGGYDSGDHKHPNAAGYRAMAQAVDITGVR